MTPPQQDSETEQLPTPVAPLTGLRMHKGHTNSMNPVQAQMKGKNVG